MVSGILNGVDRYFSVFWAILKRETSLRFGARSLGWIEEAGAIAVHIIAFCTLRIILGGGNHDGMEDLPFTTIGVMAFWQIRTGISIVSMTPQTMIRYSEFPQVTLLDVAIAKGIINLLLCLAVAFSTFYILQIIGYSRPIRDTLMVLYWLVMSGILGIACGLFLMWPFYIFPFTRTVLLVLIVRLLSIISGVFFVYTDLPYPLRAIAQWFPPLQINDKIREAYFYTYHATWVDENFCFLSTLLIFAIGLLSCELVRGKLKKG
ncbi:hypothetical protein [Labrys wisconsinensis]|uniref:Capsular polysaccharide transport system permease protein n=1 Tax=Labrys wisconsinensis TaxID=425677 RepID=A0ABU0JDI5_9HYPH|nr:hypothetical protein [Labrys wisconsinensis]MDQ0472338.1 capsular polysaccharide transport system permease protein [Labrys wisconsinensis]